MPALSAAVYDSAHKEQWPMKLVIARFVVIPVLLAVVFGPEVKAKRDIVCMNFDLLRGNPRHGHAGDSCAPY